MLYADDLILDGYNISYLTMGSFWLDLLDLSSWNRLSNLFYALRLVSSNSKVSYMFFFSSVSILYFASLACCVSYMLSSYVCSCLLIK